MKTYKVGDLEFDAEGVGDLREFVIQLRDAALEQSRFDIAVPLSNVIGVLHAVREEMVES